MSTYTQAYIDHTQQPNIDTANFPFSIDLDDTLRITVGGQNTEAADWCDEMARRLTEAAEALRARHAQALADVEAARAEIERMHAQMGQGDFQ